MTTHSMMLAPMTLRLPRALLFCVGLLSLVSCGGDDGFQPGEPAEIVLSDSVFTFTAVGQNHLFTAAVTDVQGRPVDMTLSWSTSDPAVLKLNGDGLATAAKAGTATVTVAAGSVTAVATVTISQVAAHIYAVGGSGQGGQPSQALPFPMIVQVTDALNYRAPGVLVTFATTDPGASVAPDTATTDFFGRAATTLTLGSALGPYTLTATVSGTPLTTSLNARARLPGPFAIDLVYVTNQPTTGQSQAFALAQQRWEAIITGDLPDDYASLPANSCGPSPAIDQPIDDLLIFVSLGPIDGPGGILGQAGPCFLHSVGLLPAIGQMTFDVADLDGIEAAGLLSDVVLHEMGHVLGYGTLWSDLGLLQDPSSLGGLDPYFNGPLAIASFDSLGGSGHVGAKVPVEDQGGPGTADAHWREATFENEIMTGFVNAGFNPLSAVSIASMADIGYAVDYATADPYVIAFPFRVDRARPQVHLKNDIAAGPITVLPPKGQNRR